MFTQNIAAMVSSSLPLQGSEILNWATEFFQKDEASETASTFSVLASHSAIPDVPADPLVAGSKRFSDRAGQINRCGIDESDSNWVFAWVGTSIILGVAMLVGERYRRGRKPANLPVGISDITGTEVKPVYRGLVITGGWNGIREALNRYSGSGAQERANGEFVRGMAEGKGAMGAGFAMLGLGRISGGTGDFIEEAIIGKARKAMSMGEKKWDANFDYDAAGTAFFKSVVFIEHIAGDIYTLRITSKEWASDEPIAKRLGTTVALHQMDINVALTRVDQNAGVIDFAAIFKDLSAILPKEGKFLASPEEIARSVIPRWIDNTSNWKEIDIFRSGDIVVSMVPNGPKPYVFGQGLVKNEWRHMTQYRRDGAKLYLIPQSKDSIEFMPGLVVRIRYANPADIADPAKRDLLLEWGETVGQTLAESTEQRARDRLEVGLRLASQGHVLAAEGLLSIKPTDVATRVSIARAMVSGAFERIKEGELFDAVKLFEKLGEFAKDQGLLKVETAALMARGDLSFLEAIKQDGINYIRNHFWREAYILYTRAIESLPKVGDGPFETMVENWHLELSPKTDNESREARLERVSSLLGDFWQIDPNETLFKDPIDSLRGGVAKQGSTDAIPPPGCTHISETAQRVNRELERSRRDFIEARKALEVAKRTLGKGERR